MNKPQRYFITGLAILFLAVTATAVDYKVEKLPNGDVKVTLTNGKVYYNPHIVGRTPDGLEVAHKNGVGFMPFMYLSERLQKKYNYNPEAGQAYSKQKAAMKRQMAANRRKKAQAAKANKLKWKKYFDKRHLENMEIEIIKLERRIKFLKEQIPKLEAKADKHMNSITSLAGSSTSNGRPGYSWRGGLVYSNRGKNQRRRSEKSKNRVIDGVAEEYLSSKNTLKAYRRELDKKEIRLIQMKRHYKRLKEKLE